METSEAQLPEVQHGRRERNAENGPSNLRSRRCRSTVFASIATRPLELIRGHPSNCFELKPFSKTFQLGYTSVLMDALKFAFEVLIVGALALPWVAILVRMFSPYAAPGEPEKPLDILQFLLAGLGDDARSAVAAAMIVAIGYLLGSAVTRISRNFFNDELLGRVPTEDQIRDDLYWDEYCMGQLLGDLELPELRPQKLSSIAEGLCSPATPSSPDAPAIPALPRRRLFRFRKTIERSDRPEDFSARVQELFLLQESNLLLNGEDKVERLKEYYDQITVLRGGAFNGIILCAVCLFGFCGNYRVRWSNSPVLKALTFVPAAALALYGFISLLTHWTGKGLSAYRDPPLAETVLLLLGAVGVFVILKARHATYYGPLCILAAALSLVSFGGWWWTEVMYDLHVIHSVPDLPQRGRDVTPQSATTPPR